MVTQSSSKSVKVNMNDNNGKQEDSGVKIVENVHGSRVTAVPASSSLKNPDGEDKVKTATMSSLTDRKYENTESLSARFVYLIQGPSVKSIKGLKHSSDRQIIWLTFADRSGDFYFPKSTWTQGRNMLLREAVRQASKREDGGYLYYIFLDDDAVLLPLPTVKNTNSSSTSRNSTKDTPFDIFESFLLEWEPAIGYPHYAKNYIEKGARVNINFKFDAMFTAFHRHTLSCVLPYTEEVDHISWYFSQLFLDYWAAMLYNSYRIQCNDIQVTNKRFHSKKERSSKAVVYHDSIKFEIAKAFQLSSLRNETNNNVATNLIGVFSKKEPIFAYINGTATKKNQMNYRVSTNFILDNFRADHPIIQNILRCDVFRR
ncbi:uncharacterized protein LOC106176372 [Lingula anatina]|uniref:Uncharacterized protein LOC106176372 n=1 Tax=Lingula anatina TaxID=7574 RepID=A0A1S3JVU5_LINAN|nr:uncharacterized protein LOC106176372 [Lingula anatina]|eukprot:XP_013414186.1 uncharacterized protein LOC106176372 [Lingula anatina]